mmetsp:Transcript_49413/g.140132  ORF Transcript_49413/g.140132 Transcript_49413/m.140132 type:complete len:97 (+) Transcript_49413:76-366(+)|eukprot:CAMPEP_0177472490 /NCGR_PEP_ID=MMETSP0369-20130122/21333_1 /TAXON_ID=447022 ORGANISM="Scrippsiella hangoei-like, Strain SHHI-4" /NCGR_SAMPLE_ID=MMETSP0369 /ASSEMBLY_ACC=CAM_ASM_000364 /LENGTH=96 /DNA_ID=CAMNT_0018947161 /DNA_START=71 /DNA_END=361 /DNA_ORIENTATION=-
MARRSGSVLVPLAALLVAVCYLAPVAFLPSSLPATAVAAAAGVAQHADIAIDSSVSLAGTVEPLMMGIVMGCVPITIFGLFVAAWLQFKKGPTLGV